MAAAYSIFWIIHFDQLKIHNWVQANPGPTDNSNFPYFLPRVQCAVAKGVPWKTNKIPKIWSSPHNFKMEIRTPKIVYEFSWFIRPRLQDKLSFNSFVIDNCAFMYIVMSWLFLDWYKHQYICIPKQKIHHLFVIGTVKNVVLPKT